MYRDPTKLRSRELKIRLTTEEDRLIEALSDFTGAQKAVIARELLLERLRLVMGAQRSRRAADVEGPVEGRCGG